MKGLFSKIFSIFQIIWPHNKRNMIPKANRLNEVKEYYFSKKLKQIAQLRNRPVMKDPLVMVTTRRDELKALSDRALRGFASLIEIEKKELKGVRDHLRSLSPQSTMDRGYAVVQLTDGKILRDATKLKAGTALRIRVAKGETGATVTATND